MIMAALDDVPEQYRAELMDDLIMEIEEMTPKELAFLLLHGMDDDELRARVEELRTGVTAGELSCQ